MPIPMTQDQGSMQPGQEGASLPENEEPGTASQLLSEIQANLSKLGELISKSQLPDEDKQAFDQLAGGFASFADSLQQSGDQAPQGKVPVGVNAPEAGGRPGAVPVGR